MALRSSSPRNLIQVVFRYTLGQPKHLRKNHFTPSWSTVVPFTRQLRILYGNRYYLNYSLRGAYGRWDLNDNLTNAFGRLLLISVNETEPSTKHSQDE